jgi:hypothetical protein
MAFKYKKRSNDEIERRASAQNSDFIGFIQPDYLVYAVRDGDNWIRILPPRPDDDMKHWGLDVHCHYGIGPEKASVLCNRAMWNEKCPVCEARVKAERAGDEELAKELRVNKRLIVWLIDMKEPQKGAQLWAMPKTVDQEFCKLSKDKRSGEYYDIVDPDEGYDVNFERNGKGVNTKYTGFQIARRASSVDDEPLDYIQDNPLHSVLITRTYGEVQDIFEGGVDPEDDPKPAKRPNARRAEPEEEEKPARARSGRRAEPAEEEEEEAPQPARRAARPAAEEEERPARRATARRAEPEPEAEEEDEEEEEAPPPKSVARRGRPSQLAKDLDDEIPFDDTPAERKGRRSLPAEKPAAAKAESPAEERARILKQKYAEKGR